MSTELVAEPLASLALQAPELLRVFNEAGILDSSDVHVATRLGRLVSEADGTVLLAAALVVNATRRGSVCVDLETVSGISSEYGIDEASLPWPDTATWISAVAASPLTGGLNPPLVLESSLLYLDRYHRYEQRLADGILSRQVAADGVDEAVLAADLAKLFPHVDGSQVPDLQKAAAEVAVRRRFSVIAGAPGTGKTSTVAKVMALLLLNQGSASPAPLIGLAAPTGRAAARLKEAVGFEAAKLPVDESVRAALLETPSVTLHRLLGWQPRNQSRFRHNATNPLPHDVVIVDESSMISLSMMAQLVDAVRPDARLILVGDPRQLASVDAGSAFGDIVGPVEVSDTETGIVVLQTVHRFGGEIAGLAAAVLGGDSDDAVARLSAGSPQLTWLRTGDESDGGSDPAELVGSAIAELLPSWLALVDSAAQGDDAAALEGLTRCRVLCAHRDGPFGASRWNLHALRAVASSRDSVRDLDTWFPGRPLLAVENDYQLGVFNGDSGVVLPSESGPVGVFDRAEGALRISPERLGPVQTAYAATVHRSQGSQFDVVLVVLPPPESRALSRELLYTAITRAKKRVIVLGSEASLVAAIDRRALRASGLRGRVWVAA